jgi:hypothetical protein
MICWSEDRARKDPSYREASLAGLEDQLKRGGKFLVDKSWLTRDMLQTLG